MNVTLVPFPSLWLCLLYNICEKVLKSPTTNQKIDGKGVSFLLIPSINTKLKINQSRLTWVMDLTFIYPTVDNETIIDDNSIYKVYQSNRKSKRKVMNWTRCSLNVLQIQITSLLVAQQLPSFAISSVPGRRRV